MSEPSIVTTAAAFRSAWPALESIDEGSGANPALSMRAALLVAPSAFDIAQESTADNRYMLSDASVDVERAARQHDALAAKIRSFGVPTIVFPGESGQPDGVFPNNAFATTSSRRAIVGRMHHEVRRRETAREDIRSFFASTMRYDLLDLSTQPEVAELTGSLVIDHARGIGFCGTSQRTNDEGCRLMHEAFGTELTFRFELSADEYHTNILLSVLAGRVCVLHANSFADPEVPRAIAESFAGRTLFLSDEEKAAFAGNCLAITPKHVLFSSTAAKHLEPASRDFLETNGFEVHETDVDEFEKAGGSLRCLIAEIF